MPNNANILLSLVDNSKELNSNPALSGLMTTKILIIYDKKPILNISPKILILKFFQIKLNISFSTHLMLAKLI